jgi:hypothetical protein
LITIYINYPNSRFNLHGNQNCSFLSRPRKESFRLIQINLDNLNKILADFASGKHRFSSRSLNNDMWVQVDLESEEQEIGVGNTLRMLLGQHYRRLSGAQIKRHC